MRRSFSSHRSPHEAKRNAGRHSRITQALHPGYEPLFEMPAKQDRHLSPAFPALKLENPDFKPVQNALTITRFGRRQEIPLQILRLRI